jgi:hypothetical protein
MIGRRPAIGEREVLEEGKLKASSVCLCYVAKRLVR